MGRAAALVMVCGLAACVALLGGIGDAEEPVSQAFLAVKAEIESKPASHLSGKSLKLAAKATSFSDTASGIMQEAKNSKLALVPGKVHMAAAKAKVAAANVILKGVPAASAKVGKQALDEEAPAEEAPAEEAPAEEAPAEEAPAADAPASDADATDDKPKKKVLGASGEEVFGKKDGAVAGFLGFQGKGEPNLLGIPLPIVMFLFVLTATLTCLTVGCWIARNTDILKVNKNEVGAPDRPTDDIEDTRGTDWRDKN